MAVRAWHSPIPRSVLRTSHLRAAEPAPWRRPSQKYTVSEHKQTVEEVAAAVGTHIDPHEIKKSKGLSIAEAKARLVRLAAPRRGL